MHRLADLLVRARARAREMGHPVLASLSMESLCVDPLDALAAVQPTMYWASPAARFSIAAAGSAYTFSVGREPERFSYARDRWRFLQHEAMVELCANAPGPVLMGGFAFDPERPQSATWRGFDHGMLTVPQLTLVRQGHDCVLTLNALVEPASDVHEIEGTLLRMQERVLRPRVSRNAAVRETELAMQRPMSAGQWRGLVDAAVSAISAGSVEKVVLAVEQYGRVPGFEVLDALRFLTGEHPSTFIYAVWRDDAVLFGATPERLVRVQGEHVETSVLAGSAGFGAGGRDAAGAAAALRTNAKDILEHDIVRRDIEAQLGAVCEDLRVGTPDVVTLRDIVHLHTPVEARLREGTSILDVVERLHPTPAVGGAPRDAALRFIREQEGLDRGWYAAPVGWMNAHGGEFAVALRCALVRGAGELAHVFAGCGIVEQSDADAEYEEASLKMQTAMSALRAGMIGSVARSPRARRA